MADFRKWFYVLAVIALALGLCVPASAQGGTSAVNCTNAGAATPTVRAEGLTELVGDIVFTCTGGPATPANTVVPQVNISIILSVNITSKLTGHGFNEALLIIDEPNQAAPGVNSNRPILNCGGAGAPDTSPESGPGVCSIVSDGNPATTYNGVQNKNGTGTPCNAFGCGSPNVFQGRQGSPFNTGLLNNISFLGVPFDPPGTGAARTLRFTNIRGNANQDAIASTFIQVPITAQVSITGSQGFGINVPLQGQNVAFVQHGLLTTVPQNRLDFVQCNTENGALATGSNFAPGAGPCGGPGGGGCNGGPNANGFGFFSNTPIVRFAETFASSWKVRNVAEILENGTFIGGNSYEYNGGLSNANELNQNVPGVNYNTEDGFVYGTGLQNPTPGSTPPSPGGNPPQGFGTGATGAINGGFTFNNAFNSTGFATVGQATQGTRLFLSFANVPQGSAVFVPPVIYLYRQNQTPRPVPTTLTIGVNTGVAVLVNTDSAGDTAYNPNFNGGNLVAVSNNLAVYEVLFEDPSALEQVDVPVVVAWVTNLSANPPLGLPVPNQIATVSGGFAPFYSSPAAQNPQTSASFPIPRFVPTGAPLNLFDINKCACDLLFPYVTSAGGFDTGIAIANTSLDPGANFGFFGNPQQGIVQFFYFGVGANNAAQPASQTSGVVPSGGVLTYVLSSGGGAITSSGSTISNGPNGSSLDNRAAGFTGYIIAQAGFQWCHAFAFISGLGEGPLNAGISEGYLGLILDPGGLVRTGQASENLVH